jgi:hypothetical protein
LRAIGPDYGARSGAASLHAATLPFGTRSPRLLTGNFPSPRKGQVSHGAPVIDAPVEVQSPKISLAHGDLLARGSHPPQSRRPGRRLHLTPGTCPRFWWDEPFGASVILNRAPSDKAKYVLALSNETKLSEICVSSSVPSTGRSAAFSPLRMRSLAATAYLMPFQPSPTSNLVKSITSFPSISPSHSDVLGIYHSRS